MGHFLLLRNSTTEAKETTRIETTSFINTTGRCIFLFVSFQRQNKDLGGDGVFRILLKDESQEITEQAILNGSEIFSSRMVFSQNWLRIFHPFPDGVHKVILEAEQAEEANSFMLDDIEITYCQEMSELL